MAASKNIDLFGTFLSSPSTPFSASPWDTSILESLSKSAPADQSASIAAIRSALQAAEASEAARKAVEAQAAGGMSDAELEQAILVQLAQSSGNQPMALADVLTHVSDRPTRIAGAIDRLVRTDLIERMDAPDGVALELTKLGRSFAAAQNK